MKKLPPPIPLEAGNVIKQEIRSISEETDEKTQEKDKQDKKASPSVGKVEKTATRKESKRKDLPDSISERWALYRKSLEEGKPITDLIPDQITSRRGFSSGAIGDEFYVRNAGEIILHPFLPAFFEELKLVKDKQFMDEPSRHKAVHLIHYLATGEIGLPEYDLVLPRFLCELPLHIPLEREVNLLAEEKEEGENLLRAVVSSLAGHRPGIAGSSAGRFFATAR